MLGHDWVPGEGTIIDVRWSGHKNPSSEYGRMPHFIVDAGPSTGGPFRTEVEELVLFPSFAVPSAGQVVQLECDPGRKKAKFVRSDPAINRKLQDQAHDTDDEAELNAPPGTPAAGTDPGARAHWREG
jgi:hypothetical protein